MVRTYFSARGANEFLTIASHSGFLRAADSQVPWGVDALSGTIREPAWRSKPSWYLVSTEDRMIPPPAQREMSARAGSTVDSDRRNSAPSITEVPHL